MEKVLIVDDDERLLKMLQRTLAYEGFDVSTAMDGEEALSLIYTVRPDVVILDWMLPKLDGVEVLRAVRMEKNDVPVLMLTARDTIQDRVEGLDRGADDYLVKPFASPELLARVRALLRRAGGAEAQEALTFSDLSLDIVAREVRRGSRILSLTPTEFELLLLLMRHPRQVLERKQILNQVWGYDFVGDDNVIEVYVGYLRKKMEADGEPRLIQTVRGVGYVLREDA
ncbi:MAG: response regulator transcription factor [Anaerolineae bacterium]|nr:response regulator transcription factor [Anaerolineae bacterium]